MGCNQSSAADSVRSDSAVDSCREHSYASGKKGVPPALTKTSRSLSSSSASSYSQSSRLDELANAEQSSHSLRDHVEMLQPPVSVEQDQPAECRRPSAELPVAEAVDGETPTDMDGIASCLHCMQQRDDSYASTDVLLGDAFHSGDASVLRFWAAATTALHSLMVSPSGPRDALATELFSELHRPLGRSLAARIFKLNSSGFSEQMSPQQVFVEIFTLLAAFSVGLNASVACITHAVFLVHRSVFAGVMLTPLTFRPLLLTALILASKEFHDESLRISDVQTLLPMLDLRPVAQMERRMLRLLDYRISIATQRGKQSQFAGHLRSLHLQPVDSVAEFTGSSSCRAIQQWVALAMLSLEP